MPKPKRNSLLSIDARFACFRLRVAGSPIDRFGVFACETIPPGRKVIEYTGKRMLCRKVRRRRRPRAAQRTYKVTLNRRTFLEGAIGGSGAEIINHSCEPNLQPRVLRGHILLFSRRKIRKSEELTWDYRISKSSVRIPCQCGSPRCRGTINKG
jgi:uncharacterized protein